MTEALGRESMTVRIQRSEVAPYDCHLEGGAASIHIDVGNTLDWGAGMIDSVMQ